MSHRARLASAAAVVTFAVYPAFAGSPNPGGVPGYLNPQTGAFRPAIAASATSGTTYKGRFVVTLSISIFSPIPSTTPVTCTFAASLTQSGVADYDTNTVTAVRSGSNAACTIELNYKWPAVPDSTTVALSYSIQTTDTSGQGVGRYSSISLPVIPLPAPGATTAMTLYAVI